MAYVPIPKDLNKVKTKVAFNLTKRQLIGFTLAGLVGFPVYLSIRKLVPNDIAVITMILATLPIFFVTMFEKDGLRFEQYFKYIYLHKFYQPGKRVRKEVFRNEQKNKNARKNTKKKQASPKRTKKGLEKSKKQSKEKSNAK